jgi:tetratricopeptide (TPR) repeat protein
LELFLVAAAVDSAYALATAGEAATWQQMVGYGDLLPRTGCHRARATSNRAPAAAPDLAEAHEVLARIDLLERRGWKSAEAGFRPAISLDPGYVDAVQNCAALVLTPQGRFYESIELLGHAVALAPDDNHPPNSLASICLKAGRHAEAEHMPSVRCCSQIILPRLTCSSERTWRTRETPGISGGIRKGSGLRAQRLDHGASGVLTSPMRTPRPRPHYVRRTSAAEPRTKPAIVRGGGRIFGCGPPRRGLAVSSEVGRSLERAAVVGKR